MKKICAISQNFLLQGQIYNRLSKSYYCVMENTTVNSVNVVKTTLWQSNVSNLLKDISLLNTRHSSVHSRIKVIRHVFVKSLNVD